MEMTDGGFIDSMAREIMEEIGPDVTLKILETYSTNYFYKTNAGDGMALPYYAAVYLEGEIKLNPTEYDDYMWANTNEIHTIKNIIECIPDAINKLLRLKEIATDADFVTIKNQ